MSGRGVVLLPERHGVVGTIMAGVFSLRSDHMFVLRSTYWWESTVMKKWNNLTPKRRNFEYRKAFRLDYDTCALSRSCLSEYGFVTVAVESHSADAVAVAWPGLER